MIGRTVSHYKILDKLGEGGVGIVYKAEDTRLKRIVALKFLQPQAFGSAEQKANFIWEARAAASLNHPNICTVFDIDEDEEQIFISMAYIEGINLKEKLLPGPMELDEAVRIAIQVAEGLEAAHREGILHQDIKSTNILVTGEPRAVIMDFGTARIDGGSGLQRLPLAAGTAAYMSPEQARGDAVDKRADIWSLGVCLFEMLTGQLPFKGLYAQAVIYSVLNEDPVPLSQLRSDTPAELEKVIRNAMAKRLDERYQDVTAFLAALRSSVKILKPKASAVPSPAAKPLPSIAVLPFADMSPEKDQEYFCDGIAEEIINALIKLEGLQVTARTSAFTFKGKNEDIRKIGKRLNVDTLLEGSVRKAGNRLRITAQLINVDDGNHLWTEKFDREMEDVFAIQDEITLAIVGKLKIALLGEEKAELVKRHTANLEAYHLFLKGRYFWNKRTEEGYHKSLEFFQQAYKKDSSYALACVGVADSYDLLGWYGYLPPTAAFTRARAAAEKALAMDNTLAEPQATMGWISANYNWDWCAAEKEYQRAIEINPKYATVHQWYAELLSYMGRHDEAIREGERAQELDPLSLIINNDLGQVLFYARRYDQAVEQLNKTLELDPNFTIAHFFLALAVAQIGMHDEAIREARKALDLSGGHDSLIKALLGALFAFSGEEGEAMNILAELSQLSKQKYVSPFSTAMIYVGLKRNDEAFEWFERAYTERDHWLETFKVLPTLDSIRTDPRYSDLLRRMKLDH